MSELLTRTHARPRVVRLRMFYVEPRSKTLTARWSSGEMYRYRHNARCRAAFLLDRRMDWVRG